MTHVSSDVVTFEADGSLYAILVSRVQEILDLRPIAPMPNAPAHLLGIIDLRGENVPVVDLRNLLGLPPSPDTPQTRILVVWMVSGQDRAIIGIRTDRVIEVTCLDDPELRPMTEAGLLQWTGGAVVGIGRRKGQVVSVLNLDKLFAAVPVVPVQPQMDAAK